MAKKSPAIPRVQPGLFYSIDVHSLAQQNEKLTAQVERLKYEVKWRERARQRLLSECEQLRAVALSDEHHPLCKENAELKRQITGLRETMRYWVERSLSGHHHGLAHGDISKDALTKLLLIAHPDKWSQGQPATELAHEITVTINALRERLGGTACS